MSDLTDVAQRQLQDAGAEFDPVRDRRCDRERLEGVGQHHPPPDGVECPRRRETGLLDHAGGVGEVAAVHRPSVAGRDRQDDAYSHCITKRLTVAGGTLIRVRLVWREWSCPGL